MKLHEIKILRKYWNDIQYCDKTFEIRKNDRDYQVGDLVKFIPVNLQDEFFSDKFLYQITYVLKDIPEYGLDKDYCIFGFKKVYIAEAQEEMCY